MTIHYRHANSLLEFDFRPIFRTLWDSG